MEREMRAEVVPMADHRPPNDYEVRAFTPCPRCGTDRDVVRLSSAPVIRCPECCIEWRVDFDRHGVSYTPISRG